MSFCHVFVIVASSSHIVCGNLYFCLCCCFGMHSHAEHGNERKSANPIAHRTRSHIVCGNVYVCVVVSCSRHSHMQYGNEGARVIEHACTNRKLITF